MLSKTWVLSRPGQTIQVGPGLASAKRALATAGRRYDPLRILFCGADEFSSHTLRALHALQQRTGKIKSIDVVCRPDKRGGRGMRQLHEVPIKRVALDFGLDLHQIDTFKGWSPPQPMDLIVAVSFGLLVPARVLTAATYGGLNVHPSLLPEFRGAAPIQRALLRDRPQTGVSLQTMHPTRFDHGIILDQTSITIPPESTVETLVNLLGPIGADMLAKGVENDIFVPPLRDIANQNPNLKPSYAPKITPEDKHIDWATWAADEVLRRDRVLGRLWDDTTYSYCMCGALDQGLTKRVIFHGPWTTNVDQYEYRRDQVNPMNAGRPIGLHERWPSGKGAEKTVQVKHHPSQIGICTVDGRIVVPSEISVEGQKKYGGRKTLSDALPKMGPTEVK